MRRMELETRENTSMGRSPLPLLAPVKGEKTSREPKSGRKGEKELLPGARKYRRCEGRRESFCPPGDIFVALIPTVNQARPVARVKVINRQVAPRRLTSHGLPYCYVVNKAKETTEASIARFRSSRPSARKIGVPIRRENGARAQCTAAATRGNETSRHKYRCGVLASVEGKDVYVYARTSFKRIYYEINRGGVFSISPGAASAYLHAPV